MPSTEAAVGAEWPYLFSPGRRGKQQCSHRLSPKETWISTFFVPLPPAFWTTPPGCCSTKRRPRPLHSSARPIPSIPHQIKHLASYNHHSIDARSIAVDIYNIQTHPVRCKNYEEIPVREAVTRDFRDGDDAVFLEVEVPESSGHGEPRVVLVGQPHALNVGLRLEREHTAVALPYSLGFLCIYARLLKVSFQSIKSINLPNLASSDRSYQVRWALDR